MMVTESMIPMVIVPLSFLFVLLIILVSKVPKVGLWVVGGVILVAPIVFLRFARAGAFANEAGIPLFIVPLSFLFVLLIILLAKAPRAGVALVVALVVIAVMLGLFFGFTAWDRRVEYGEESPAAVAIEAGSVESRGAAPIWSEGVETEFEADVYPSRLSAVRAAGPQLARSIPGLARDPNSSPRTVVFQQTLEYGLIAELRNALAQALPDVPCDIEAESRTVTPDEVAVTLQLGKHDVWAAPWARSSEPTVANGRIDINLSGHRGKVHLPVRFTEKPWVEDFATFASMRPKRQFSVGVSSTACLSESEAREQAMQDAAGQVQRRIGRQWKVPGGGELTISPQDLEAGALIADTFLQSFYGSAGRIWRQAVLVDASPKKLKWLAARMDRAASAERTSWARMGFSVVGVLVLIGSIYFFLNMATRGYYEWSLRIAGVVLAIVAVISVLMMVR